MQDQHITGADLIGSERRRQIESERFSAEHDDVHTRDELAWAAICYVIPPKKRQMSVCGMCWGWKPQYWPESWSTEWWKPGAGNLEGRISELVKAGALIAAEIDRLKRAGVFDPSI
ncbi:hypothetical protein [Plasticicumulans acidivorans]|uniref:Uncharacterized protein n=1 Tax=Plasticicumulans acidivorans TaxID=886464 RepID=A0A317N1L4_9GAMM|nr:hypothetical protein [Plasticicumulans acidivorans]PWV66020.1 hypothetical protein C7443_101508 [Plasticicumulans acidivorans]